jgi:ABC-type transport system substrate-binding protein
VKKGIILVLLSCLLALSLVLPSCTKSNTSKTTTTPATVVTTTTSTGNWWSSLGSPQYGGTMTIRMNSDVVSWDPYGNAFVNGIFSGYMERLFTDDWTLNPSVFAYEALYRPSDFVKGQLANTWEFTDPTTLVVHLRQNVYWQNLTPSNGRQFVAADVVAHYTRMYDSTKGTFSNVGPHATAGGLAKLLSVTATDNFTVTFKWSTSNQELVYETVMLAGDSENCIEDPNAVAQWGNLDDWHHAIGTGPFILTNFVGGSSANFVKNTNYWGIDERYPQNKLPYIDALKILIVPDDATALADLRTGKIDVLDGMLEQQAKDMQQTNPTIAQLKVPEPYGIILYPRNDVKPFSDIKVREALQMSINLPELAQSYYQGSTSPDPVSLTSEYLTGWGYPYSQWPQDLKDQYAYNPTQAKTLLAAAGYPTGFNTDIVVPTTFDMDLLALVQNYFKAINVNMSIQTLDPADFDSTIMSGHKNDALAGTTGLGYLIEPLAQINMFNSDNRGVNGTDAAMVSDPAYDVFSAEVLSSTTIDGVKSALRGANKEEAEQHFVISLLQPTTFSLVQPWLKGYNGEYGATEGNWGANFLFFYPARFWITPH